MTKVAIVVGGTGVVGRELVAQLCNNDHYSKVISLGRRELAYQHDKLEQQIVNFDDKDSWQQLIIADDLFCALGTTLKQAGSKAAQEKIDLDLPVQIAIAAKSNGVKGFGLVSSSAADASSNSYYFSLKGKLEQELQSLNFEQLTIVQPSVLVGQRTDFRLGETIAIKLLNALQFLPVFKQYKPITGVQVAKALIHFHLGNQDRVLVKKLEQLFI